MRRLVYHNCYYPDIIYREKMSEIEELCKITNFLSALFFVFTEITKVGWSKKVLCTWTAQTDLAKYDHMAIKSSIINDRFLCMIVRNEKKIFVLFHCWRNFFMSVVSLLIRENKKSNSTTIENLINQQCN